MLLYLLFLSCLLRLSHVKSLVLESTVSKLPSKMRLLLSAHHIRHKTLYTQILKNLPYQTIMTSKFCMRPVQSVASVVERIELVSVNLNQTSTSLTNEQTETKETSNSWKIVEKYLAHFKNHQQHFSVVSTDNYAMLTFQNKVVSLLTKDWIDQLDKESLAVTAETVSKLGISCIVDGKKYEPHIEICSNLLNRAATLKDISTTELTTVVNQLATCNVLWLQHVHCAQQQNVKQRMRCLLPTMNGRDLSELLSAFSGIKLTWQCLQNDLQQAVLSTIVKQIDTFHSHSSAVMLHSLRKLGLNMVDTKCQSISPQLYALAGNVFSPNRVSDKHDILLALSGLDGLKMTAAKLPASLLNELLAAVWTLLDQCTLVELGTLFHA